MGSPFFETPNLSFEGRVGILARALDPQQNSYVVHGSRCFRSRRYGYGGGGRGGGVSGPEWHRAM